MRPLAGALRFSRLAGRPRFADPLQRSVAPGNGGLRSHSPRSCKVLEVTFEIVLASPLAARVPAVARALSRSAMRSSGLDADREPD